MKLTQPIFKKTACGKVCFKCWLNLLAVSAVGSTKWAEELNLLQSYFFSPKNPIEQTN